MTTRFGESVIFEESFVYDKRGWITDLTRTQGGATVQETYGYDARGRLETVHQDGQPRSSYTYDANSNRTSYTGPFPDVTTTVYDARDRLLQSGDVTYTYSEAGELTSKSANDHTISYDYDVLGNLRQVVLDTGITIDYVIDPAGRRIGKKIEGALVKGWLYQNGLSPIAELDGAGNLVSRFVYGTRAHVPDYMVRDGITYRIVSDRLGSPRVVVNVSTGAVAQELRYDEFGRITLDTNPGFQPFGFAGGLYDEQTGLLRMGARDYNPEIGRWTTPDPIGFRSGDTNLYNYAGSNPVVWADPLGLSLVDGLWGFAKGAVVGLAVGAGAAAIVATAPAAGTALAVAGAISLATAYYEGVAAYYDPNVSEDQMHELIGEVAGSVVGCVAGFKMVRGPGGGGEPAIPGRGVNPLPGTRVRPDGVPESWRIRPTRSRGGTEYYNPLNPNESVRVMQGNPNSPFPNSQNPYVRQRNSAGDYLDANGNPGGSKSPETHIPLEQFRFRLP